MDDFQADDFQEDDFQPDNIPDKQNILQIVKKGAAMAHPLNILKKTADFTSSVFNKSGERTAEALSERQVNPYVAAGVGTAISMAPDIAMSFSGGVKPSKEAIETGIVTARPLARRAAGFSKNMLKTPYARGMANKAAEIALREKAIPWSGNPETMLQNVSDIAARAESRITPTLEKTKVGIGNAISNLENLKSQVTQGAGREGIYKGFHTEIDKIISDMSDFVATGKSVLPSNKMSAKALNVLKNKLGKSINYLADMASQTENKALVNNLANTIRDAVKSTVSPNEFIKFLESQKLYNAAELLKKGLNNEVAGQMGNRLVSPYAIIPATGELAAGNPGQAMATLGVGEALMRRGAGTGARAIQEGSKLAPVAPAILDIATTPTREKSELADKITPKNFLKKKTLTEEKALEFLDQAGDDIEKAKELARKAGYNVP